MAKRVMGGPCVPQTDRMVAFLRAHFDFRNVQGYFVNGVRAFKLGKDLQTAPADEVYTFEDRSGRFRMSAEEIRRWQKSFRVFYADDVYQGQEGRQLIQKTLRGGSEAGDEAFKVKFAARISLNPVLCTFSADVVPRDVGDEALERIMLVSMSGVDFAGRHHDVDDIRRFIRNWRDVYAPTVPPGVAGCVCPGSPVRVCVCARDCGLRYHLTSDGSEPVVYNGRDFMPKHGRPDPDLDVPLLVSTLKKMARVRLRAQDALKVQVRAPW